MSELYLGVDGGGTKTIARVVSLDTSGRLCVEGTGQAPGSNPFSVGWEASEANVLAAVRGALQGLGEEPLCGVLAIAGCASEEARLRVARWARSADLARRLDVAPDTEPLLAEAAPGVAAVGLIAGTGSSAIARDASGKTTLVGGWGYLIDDAGSGYALGREALRAVTRDHDGLAGLSCESLREAVMQHLQVSKPNDIKAAVYRSEDPRRTVAGLAPTLLGLAESGESAARLICEQGATELAALLGRATSLCQQGSDAGPGVFLSGSLLQRSAFYRALLQEKWGQSGGRLNLAPDAACGCARLATRLKP